MDKRVAIVTGASRGIGRGIAKRLARDGRHVVAVARNAAQLESLVSEIAADGGSAEARTCDLSDGAAVQKLVEDVAEAHGRLDILVNNAGITKDGLLMRMSDADFDEVLNVNLRSVFIACRAAARPMLRGKFGRVVNIGSVSGVEGNKGQANYAAAKAGVIGLTKSVAKELGSKGVTANVVAPGFIETDMTAFLGPDDKKKVCEHITVGRLGVPEDIAAAVSYLTADDAGYITGQVLVVDGGLPM
ncbi:MAG: 3-oxoacyl-[acyl-carrier-protein] reductase FabG [Planctomycetota bacterium]|jgi:3-oxoacyl-[acyl-carrier protein] reductase